MLFYRCKLNQVKYYIIVQQRMSERHYKWKDINTTPQRLNNILAPRRELPTKFAPAKDRSLSVDKLFNNSRSRMHSSVEMQALNQTREESNKEKTDQKEESKKKEEQVFLQKKFTMNKFPTLQMGNRLSSMISTDQNFFQQSNLVLSQLKKQFWAFKQNVLRELDRQKQIVHKFMKEIVLSMQFQMQKILKKEKFEGSDSKSGISTADNQIKSIQQWKNSLNNIKINNKIDHKLSQNFQSTVKYSTSPQKFTAKEQQRPQTFINPPKMPIDLSLYLKSISRLKNQFNEMDKILNLSDSKALFKR